MVDHRDPDFRTVRGYQLASQRQGQLTPAMEDYLEMTCRLCLKSGYTRIGQLAELLSVTPSSVSKMISKLSHLGYVHYEPYQIVQLTAAGRELGEYLLERHKTVESLLKLIGSTNLLEETELIEHALSPSTVASLLLLVEFFETDQQAADRLQAYLADRRA